MDVQVRLMTSHTDIRIRQDKHCERGRGKTCLAFGEEEPCVSFVLDPCKEQVGMDLQQGIQEQ